MEANLNIIDTRKKVIGRIALVFLLIVLLLTFFSKTINNLLLAEVDYTAPYSGTLEKSVEAAGEICRTNVVQVTAKGVWLVNQINVKAGDEVKKGDVLAVLDENKVELGLKSLQLEVMKLQNDLDNYKNSFDSTDIKAAEKDAERAKKTVERCKERLETIKNLYDAGTEPYTSIKDAQDTLDNAEDDYSAKLEAVEKMRKDKQEKSGEYERTVKQMEFELEIKKAGLENYEKELPRKGEILAKADGVVRTAAVQAGKTTLEGEVMFELASDGGNAYVTWRLNGKKAREVQKSNDVTVKITEPEEKELTGKVESRKYLAQEGIYECTALINTEGVQLEDGQEVTVKVGQKSTEYDAIIPSSAVIKDSTGVYVYVVDTRNGALGEEQYIKKMNVNVEDSDDFNSAVSGLDSSGDLKVVTYSTKVLYSGVQVKTR